jgi:hypothetical protein
MSNFFFERPILNSPYHMPSRHWELDQHGQPTQQIISSRRKAEFITPIPKPRKRKSDSAQQQIVFDEGKGISTKEQQYDPTSMINQLRVEVDKWRSLPHPDQATGIDIRGRSKVLQVNYRTSHQIRQQADRLLAPEITDADGNAEDRSKTISVFNGPLPDIRVVETEKEESSEVAAWISQQINNGTAPHEIGLFVRSDAQVSRAVSAIKETGVSYTLLDESMEVKTGKLAVSTMHLAKGLEFRCVAVMACDDEVIPLQERIAGVTEDSDLREAYNTERHLLYVACTRARDVLLVIGVNPASEFLQDLSIS